MAKTDYKSVDEYIATHPETVQEILAQVRDAIRAAVPEAEEVISYQIPHYKLHGGRLIYFAGFKEHFSLYPAGERLVAEFERELEPYAIGKGTIRFPLGAPPPTKLIGRIAQFRAKELASGVARKNAKKKPAASARKAAGAKKAAKKARVSKKTRGGSKKASSSTKPSKRTGSSARSRRT
jgi:uncharacterized protein YdhG (YjbR/CyaY superfamily)